MHDDGHHRPGFGSGPDVKIGQLDQTIRQLESQASTWTNPLQLTRLRALRRTRAAIERTRLAVGWSLMGTDAAGS